MARETKIDPKEWYNLNDIVRHCMFPWTTTFRTARKFVEVDSKGSNVLKATITGKGRGTKYLFKGENIIKFVNSVSAGKSTR